MRLETPAECRLMLREQLEWAQFAGDARNEFAAMFARLKRGMVDRALENRSIVRWHWLELHGGQGVRR